MKQLYYYKLILKIFRLHLFTFLRPNKKVHQYVKCLTHFAPPTSGVRRGVPVARRLPVLPWRPGVQERRKVHHGLQRMVRPVRWSRHPLFSLTRDI